MAESPANIKGANVPRRRALGRGLSALMESTLIGVKVNKNEEVEETPVNTGFKAGSATQAVRVVERKPAGLEFLLLTQLEANPNQPRRVFKDEEIAELARSIKETGLLQPIIVRPYGINKFQIVAGERRFRAASLAGLTEVPAIVRDITDRETLELGIIENIQRADLNAVEEARAFSRLISDFGASQEEVARSVGKDRSSIANALRLLKLPVQVLDLIANQDLSAGHARAVLMLVSPTDQIALAKRIVDEKLSVRQAESIARGDGVELARTTDKAAAATTTARKKSSTELRLEEQLRRELGTKVSVQLNEKGRGELRIQFFSKQELERLLERLQVKA